LAFSTIQGSGGAPDSFVGTSGVDSIAIVDSTGNYFLGAQQANDIVNLNTTANPLYTRVVSNTELKGGQGDDSFTWTSGAATTYVSSWVNGNSNADTLTFAAGDSFLSSTLHGGQGADTINGSTSAFSATLVNGNKNNDTLTFNGVITNSSLFGGQGNDTIRGNTVANTNAVTNSVINGDDGNDTISFNFAGATLKSLNGTSISGGAGIDVISLANAGVTGDTVFVNGNGGTDTINGTLVGSASLFGGQGVDTITSGGAATTFVGGEGADVMTAGAGVDRFYYTAFGQGGAGVAGNNGSAITGGDLIGSIAAADFVGIETDIVIGSTAVAAATTQNNWNVNSTGVAIFGATAAVPTTAAAISTLVGTVVGDAGDTAYVVINDTTNAATAVNGSILVQVTLGATRAAGAGTVLGAQDTINLLGTFTQATGAGVAPTANLAAGQIQFI
jgi:Ca2+-binding RTX toxin-like protein